MIHQIFIDIDIGTLQDFPKCMENSRAMLDMYGPERYKLWQTGDIIALWHTHADQFGHMVEKCPHQVYMVDLSKYLILSQTGVPGIYVTDFSLRAGCFNGIPKSSWKR
jgi:mannosyltransferase OCH1-like enzyme